MLVPQIIILIFSFLSVLILYTDLITILVKLQLRLLWLVFNNVSVSCFILSVNVSNLGCTHLKCGVICLFLWLYIISQAITQERAVKLKIFTRQIFVDNSRYRKYIMTIETLYRFYYYRLVCETITLTTIQTVYVTLFNNRQEALNRFYIVRMLKYIYYLKVHVLISLD